MVGKEKIAPQEEDGDVIPKKDIARDKEILREAPLKDVGTIDEGRSWFTVIVQDVPAINLVYDLLFDSVPTENGLKDALNLLGLVDALLLGLIISVMTSISYDELIAADLRFTDPESDPNGYYKLFKSNKFWPAAEAFGSPSSAFAYGSFLSVTLMFVALMTVILTFLDFTNKNFEGKTKRESNQLFESWWYFARFVVFSALFETIYGTVIMANSTLIPLLAVKYPDYYVAAYGKLKQLQKYPFGEFSNIAASVFILYGCIALLGLGTRNRFIMERQLRKRNNNQRDNECDAKNKKDWEELFASALDVIPKEDLDGFIESLVEEKFPCDLRHLLSAERIKSLGMYTMGYQAKIESIIESSIGKRFC